MISYENNRCDFCRQEFLAGGSEGIVFNWDEETFDLCNSCSQNENVYPTAFYQAQVGNPDYEPNDEVHQAKLIIQMRQVKKH